MCGWTGGSNQGIFFMEGNDFTQYFCAIFLARAPKQQSWGKRQPGMEGDEWVKDKEVRQQCRVRQHAACSQHIHNPQHDRSAAYTVR